MVGTRRNGGELTVTTKSSKCGRRLHISPVQVAQLTPICRLGTRAFRVHGHDGRTRRSASGQWHEVLWVLGADAVGVETLRVAELGVDVDDEALSATVRLLLAHKIDGEVGGELDE